jgi:hypothetical protein
MNRRISLKVRGSGGETDAPTVQDFLGQLRDFFEILKGVEQAVAPDAKNAIDWRIVNASMNSPIRIEAEAFAREFGANIDHRVNVVVKSVAEGMRQVALGDHRPTFFTDAVLTNAESFFKRVTNGLSDTVIEYGDGELPFELDPAFARIAERKVGDLLNPSPKAYREFGSVEGFFKGVETDGFNRTLLWIKHRISGADVKCVIPSDPLRAKIASEQIREIWNKRRLLVTGAVYFKAIGKIDYIEAIDFRLLRQKHELPTLDEILDVTFTNGLQSEDYLRKLRNGEIH